MGATHRQVTTPAAARGVHHPTLLLIPTACSYEADLLRWFERLLSDLRKRIDTNTVGGMGVLCLRVSSLMCPDGWGRFCDGGSAMAGKQRTAVSFTRTPPPSSKLPAATRPWLQERLRSSEVPVMLIEDQQRLDNMAQQISDLVARAAVSPMHVGRLGQPCCSC